MKKYRRIFVVVLDSLGAGAMDDAAQYGDAGTDTLGHISASVERFTIPNLQKLGLANLHPLKQVAPVEHPLARYTTLREASCDKDTMTVHFGRVGRGRNCHRAYDCVYLCGFCAANLRQ